MAPGPAPATSGAWSSAGRRRSAGGTGSGRRGSALEDEVAEIGVVSDTHGLLRSELFGLFEGVDLVLHGGDVGDPAILASLEAVAPVEAVWGNVDGWEVRDRTSEVRRGEIAGLGWAVIHGHQVPDYDRLPHRFPDAGLIVHGHSHVPAARRVNGALMLNPGSAGPRRFDDPVTAARVVVREGRPEAAFRDLLTGKPFEPTG